MLIRLWRRRWSQQKGLYNSDDRHQCLHHDRSSIVRPYVCAPHFYACVQCGQEHRCYGDARHCWPAVDPNDTGNVCCLYSGASLPLQPPTDFVGTFREQQIAKDNAGVSLASYLAHTAEQPRMTRAKYRPSRPLLYTNIRLNVASLRDKPKQKKTKKPYHREKRHPSLTTTAKSPPSPSSSTSTSSEELEEVPKADGISALSSEETVDDDDDQEGICSVQRFMERRLSYTNEEYCDSEFDFIHQHLAPLPAPPKQHTDTACERNVQSVVVRRDLISVHDRQLLHDSVGLLVSQMCALQRLAYSPGGTTMTEGDRVQLQVFFARRAEAVALLLFNSPVMTRLSEERRVALAKHNASVTTVSRSERHEIITACHRDNEHQNGEEAYALTLPQIAEALMLHLFAEEHCDEDQCGNRIVVWPRHPWLAHVVDCDLTPVLYGDRVDFWCDTGQKRQRVTPRVSTTTTVKKTKHRSLRLGETTVVLAAPYSQKRVKQAVKIIRDSLAHYKGHGFWLRHFILDHGKS